MGQFTYKALDQAGKASDGNIDAPSKNAAIAKLRAKSLYVLEIQSRSTSLRSSNPSAASKRVESTKSFSTRLLERHQPISSHEQIFFFRQLAVMLQSGLPLLQALEVCQMQGKNRRLQKHIRDIVAGIQSGKRFSQCLQSLRGIFPYTAIRLIETGEASGELDHVLERVATHLEMKVGLRSKLITSLA